MKSPVAASAVFRALLRHCLKPAFAPACALILMAAPSVRAHTVSIGYENAGPGTLRFWYGTYHAPSDGPLFEGSFTLVGINGNPFPSTTVSFNLSAFSKPSGLIDGVTNFYANTATQALSATPYPSTVRKWQGVTFSGLAAGDYRFTYNPIAFPTATWNPIINAVRSSTVTVTIAQLIAAPVADAGPDVTVSQGATVTLNGSGSYDPNTPPKAFTYAWTQESGPAAINFSGTNTATPTFTVPAVPASGGSLVFKLTVSNGESSLPGTDTVTVNVLGNSPPTADAGPDQTVATTAGCSASVTLAGSGADPEGSAVTYSWSGPFGTVAGATPTVTLPKGANTLTLTVTDDKGATATDTVVVTVVDTEAPHIVANGDITVNAASGSCAAVVNLTSAVTATDNCAGVSVSFLPQSGSSFAKGETVVTATATDASGNMASTTFKVIVRDAEAPTVIAQATNKTVETDGAGNAGALSAWLASNGGASATDNCGAVTWSNNYHGLTAACGSTGSATVVFTATDSSGNSTTTTATFTIVDTTAPKIVTAAAGQTVECSANSSSALAAWLANNGGAAATDVGSAVKWSNNFTALAAACGATGSATVTFTATDACGNAASTTATFTIVDTTKPVVGTPAANLTVESDGNGNSAALSAWLAGNAGAVATDACSAVTWTNNFSGLTKACGSTGSATVVFTATDACGNASTTTATFTIVDTTKPSIVTAPSNKTVESDGAGNVAALSAWLAANGGGAATDIGSAVTWSNNYTATTFVKACGTTGAATVTFTATDACGNASSATATFTIIDTTKPVLASNVRDISPNEKPMTFTVSSTDIGGSSTPTITGVTAVRINPATKTIDKTNVYKYAVSGNAITITISGGVGTIWTIDASAVDECGNVATAQYIINVVNPTLTK